MNKKLIRLTESDLHRIVKESVKKILSETSFQRAQAAYQASQDPNRQMSPAMQRRMSKNSMAAAQQMSAIKQGATNSFNREYGYNLKNVPFGSGDDINMEIADTSKPFYGGSNLYRPNSNVFREVGGMPDTNPAYTRTTMQKNFNNDTNYQEDDVNMSVGNALKNPGFASAVMRGRKAVDKTNRQ